MGVTITCPKTGRSVDMGGGGFWRLRLKVAELAGDPWVSHYRKLERPPSFDPERTAFFEAFDAETLRLVNEKKVHIKIADFCLQTDCGGAIRYGACKLLLKFIGDYDDNICYGYAGRPDCAKFRDFKAILQDCAEHKCDMRWS